MLDQIRLNPIIKIIDTRLKDLLSDKGFGCAIHLHLSLSSKATNMFSSSRAPIPQAILITPCIFQT